MYPSYFFQQLTVTYMKELPQENVLLIKFIQLLYLKYVEYYLKNILS